MAFWYFQLSTKLMVLTRLLWSAILFSVSVKDAACNLTACLTWQHNGNFLRLICRLNNDRRSVSIIDPNNIHRAYCNIYLNGVKCISTFTDEYVEFKENLRQIVLTVSPVQNQFDGKWICQQGNSSYTTKVDMAEGIISSTKVRLQGKMHESNGQRWTQLTCTSCRTPHKNIAEFQMNGRTVAQIRFDRRTNTCILRNETCNGTRCMCSLNENEFFLRMKVLNGSSYSCVMLFVDNEIGNVFQQRSTLFFDGKVLHRSDTETDILEKAATTTFRTATDIMSTVTQQEEDSNIFSDYLGVWIACFILILLAILVLVLTKIGLHIKIKKKESDHIKSTDTEEEKGLIDYEHGLKEERDSRCDPPVDKMDNIISVDLDKTKVIRSLTSTSRNDAELPHSTNVELTEEHSEHRDEQAENRVVKPSNGCELINVTVHSSESQKIESVPLFDIPMEIHLYQKRWLLFGLSCLKVYHSFRRDIERLFSTKFNILKMKYDVEKLTYEGYEKTEVPNTDWQLNYKVINDNGNLFGDNVEKYDFRIKSATELSKMVIPEKYTHYSAFDDTMSFGTILHLFNVFSLYKDPEGTFRSKAEKIFQSTWSRWCVPRTTDWDEEHLKESTSLLVEMSAHYLQSNQEPMSENEIEMITEKGMSLLDGPFELEDKEVMNRIVSYMTELIQFLDVSQSETSSNEIHEIKRTISAWRSKLKKSLDESYLNNEQFKNNCKLCHDKNKNKKADCWCLECDVHYCKKCKDMHLSMKPLMDHNFIDADLYSELLPVNRKCQKHVLNDVEYFCAKHDELCCRTCLIACNEHRKCDGIHQISDIKTKTIEKLNLYKKQLDEQQCVLQRFSALNVSVFKVDSNDGSCVEIEQLVRGYCHAKDENFEDYQQALKTNLNEVKHEIASEFNELDLETNLKEIVKELDQERHQFEIIMKTNSEKLLFLFIHSSAIKLNITETRISTLANHFSDKTKSKSNTNVQILCMQAIGWLLKSYKKSDLFHQE